MRTPTFKINRELNSPASKHEPEVQQMFLHTHFKSDDTEMSETYLKESYIKQDVSFIQHTEPVETSSADTPHESENINTIISGTLLSTKCPKLLYCDSETTFAEISEGLKELPRPVKDRKQEQIFEDRPSIDAKEALKRRHDLSLRQMMRLEKEEVSKRPDIYETPKISSWAQKEPTSKYRVESKMDIKIPPLKHKGGPRGTRDYVSNHYDNIKQGLHDSEEGPKKVKKLEDRYDTDEELKLQQKKKVEDKKKHEKRQIKLEEEQKRPAGQKKYSEKDLESKPVVEEKKQDKSRRDESKEKDRKIISESKVIGEISKVAKKHVMPKPDHRDKTDEVSEKTKMEVKVKPEKKGEDEILQKYSKDLKSRRKQKDHMNEVSVRDVVKKQKVKPEKEDRDEKTQEKEAQKAQAAKDREVKDAPSKEKKASKKTQDGSDELKVSMSKIQKSFKKETSGKQETVKIKQEKGKELESKTLKESPVPMINIAELQKLQEEHLKQKEIKRQLEHQAKVAKAREDESKAKRDELERLRKEGSGEKKLVAKKQDAKMSPSDIHPNVLAIHKRNHQQSGRKSSSCHLCVNSDLELEVLSLDNKKKLTTDISDIIIGEQIFKYKPHLEKIKEPEDVPILFQKEFCVESDQQLKQIVQIIPQETKPDQNQILLTKFEMEPGAGVVRYALSDRTFIDKGWTMLPTEKVVRKMNVYRMRPAHPEFDWFEHNKNKRLMTYDTGEKLAEFDDNGRGRWYYRNGRLALDYYDAEETNAQQRFVIYSSGEPDVRGRTHPVTILATFDYLGNGIVFDHAGKIRLKYNQTEGVVLDREIGPVSHWQWHSLNDPPVLQQVMIDTQMALKDPNIIKLGSAADETTRPDNEEMLAIEFDNFIKEKSKKLSQKFKPFQIRMKALKINEHFSLKVLDQATVYLIFRDGSTNLKLNIGMILDHQEIVDTDTAEVGEVSNSLERLPARTDSLAGLQRTVAHAQRYERQHAKRERWLRPPEPCASADLLTAAASAPMRLPFRTVPTGSSSSTGYCSRKPTNNLYYDTRLRC